jgi:hypothetical protein
MVLNKWQVYVSGFIIIALCFIGPRLYWLHTAISTKAVVLYTAVTTGRRTKQPYPMFQYRTNKTVVTAGGHYNLPYYAGDSVLILYSPTNHTSFKVDNFKGRWFDISFWLLLIFFVWTVLFLPKDINFSVIISGRKLKWLKNEV